MINEALIILRVVIGLIFIVHGLPKLKDFKGTEKFVKKLGFKPVNIWAFLLGFTEFFGGLFILFGFLTKLSSLGLLISMSVALYFQIFKWNKEFKGGYEFDVLIIAVLIVFILLGAGIYSIDSFYM